MTLFKKTFRLWWKKPREASKPEESRSVSFLELFYDLSYVVIIAELTHALVGHLSLANVGAFIGLYALVWWAWVNGSMYHELHGNNDIRTRVMTFLQMFALAGMGIFAHNALGEGYRGFALSYTFFLLVITFLWWRTGVHDEKHRPMSQPYVTGFLITTAIFAISAFIDRPYAFYLWIGGSVFSLLLPLLLFRRRRRVNQQDLESAQRIRPSLVERFGLLTIIVLGEVIVAVVRGASSHTDARGVFLLMVALGILIAFAMWWVYFDFISHRMPIQKQYVRFAWLYLHLPVTMSIALTGAGLLTALEKVGSFLSPNEVWLLVAPIGIFLLCIVLLINTIQIKKSHLSIHLKASQVALLSGIAMFLLGFMKIGTLWLLVIITLLLLLPVLASFYLWVKGMHLRHHS